MEPSQDLALRQKQEVATKEERTVPGRYLDKVTLEMLRNQACSSNSLQVGAIDNGPKFTFLWRVSY
jgi:hypothetical protein